MQSSNSYRLLMANSENLSREIFYPEFQTSLRLKGMSEKEQLRTEHYYQNAFVIRYKIKGFKEKLGCVVVSTFLIFMFVD